MNDFGGRLSKLFDDYISLEKEIQKLIFPISHYFCRGCLGNCCRAEICKESIESTFLSILTEKQRIRFDNQNGWLGPLGCRLDYGRPLVCYEFFLVYGILRSLLFSVSPSPSISLSSPFTLLNSLTIWIKLPFFSKSSIKRI